MLFSVAAGFFLMASSVAAAPSNLEKRGYNVVYETVYQTVKAVQPANNYGNVVYKTVTLNARPKHRRPHHHHKSHHKSSSSSCNEAATQQPVPPYQVITKTYVNGGYATQSAVQPANPGHPNHHSSVAPAPPSYTPPTYSGGGGAPQGNMQAVVDLHNSLRAKHGCGPLAWSDTIASHACAVDHCVFEHHGDGYGENLAQGYPNPVSAVQAWYDEISYYSYNNPVFGDKTGHFTQVVWKASTEIGCCFSQCKDGPILRCEYSQPGNFKNKFSENVLPLGGGGGGYGN